MIFRRVVSVSAPLVLLATVFLASCGRETASPGDQPRHYEVRGMVRALPPDHQTVEIEHEDIPGFMPSMTMPFSVRDGKEIADLRIGDAISFRLNLTKRDSWIDQVRVIDSAKLNLPTPAAAPRSSIASSRLHEGDPMPAFQLVDESGKTIDLESFHGHPFVLTFIFTRCPIPNFCPRMAQDFSELQKAIKASSAEPLASTRLLSISFDPEHDTPVVLSDYAREQKADAAIWRFATGDPAEVSRLTKAFSVLVQPEGGSISHSLATALIDKNGRIEKIWRGNGWTPAEVIQQISGLSNVVGSPSSATPGR